MFGFNKRMRAFSHSVHSRISECASSCVRRVKHKIEFDRRVEQANTWASLHPHRFFATVLGVSAVILASSFLVGLSPDSTGAQAEPRPVNPSQNVGIDRVINGMRAIHTNNDIINTTVIRARMLGDQLRHEIDSLRRLPVVTHEDSLAIAQKGKQLEGIINFFERNEED